MHGDVDDPRLPRGPGVEADDGAHAGGAGTAGSARGAETLSTAAATTAAGTQSTGGTGSAAGTGLRRDVEGLRAVAILLVVVHHIWTGRVSGGVDVFLLVSGFFVGGGLLRRFRSGRPPELGPYVRRLARRLLPAALVVLAAVVVGTVLLLPRTRWADVAGQVLASVLYGQNWQLAVSSTAYGAADSSASPLQHFWSLSIQGQLFVGLPLVLLLVWRTVRRRAPHLAYRAVVATVLAASAGSFAYACWVTAHNQPWAYFDTAARAWEYLAGTVLALTVAHLRLPAAARAALGWVGLLLVLATGLVVDGARLFPGPATLLPIAGAVMVVTAGAARGRGGVDVLLSWRPISSAGAYAYGLYLWHWPLLVGYLAVTGRQDVGRLAGAGVLVLSVTLAALTHLLVEVPLRGDGAAARNPSPAPARRRPPTAVTRLVAVAVVVTVAVPVSWLAHVELRQRQVRTFAEDLDRATHPGALSLVYPAIWPAPSQVRHLPDPLDAAADLPQVSLDGCLQGLEAVVPLRCDYGDPSGRRRVLLIGGSHSEHYFDALDEVARARGIALSTYLKMACPVQVYRGQEGYPECRDWSRRVVRSVTADPPDAVVLTSTRPLPGGGGDHVPAGYLDLWRLLDEAGVPVVALRDVPWLPFSGPDCVSSSPAPQVECTVPRSEVLREADPAASVELPPGVGLLDLTDAVCDDDVCRAVAGNVLVYRDSNHLTATFSRSLAPVLDERLGALTGWW